LATQYFWDRGYAYNDIGGDECISVTLWQGEYFLAEWQYSTFLSEGLAERRAARRIRNLTSTYGATPRPR